MMLSMFGSPRRVGPSADNATADDALGGAVALAQRGEEDAFRFVYRAVQPGLLRYLRGLVGEDAEDIASEAWSQIVRDLHGFQGHGHSFRGWAATIARNRALDHVRKQHRRPQPAGVSATDLISQVAPDDTASAALDRIATRNAIALIASLPPDQAEAVLLRVVMGLDVATTAQVLDKRSGAVRTAAHRGLRRLADQLASPASAAEDGAEGYTDLEAQ
jgi:RNA polymerase sigma-70 factor (ECF subfamily)